jgi:hypothetical protein
LLYRQSAAAGKNKKEFVICHLHTHNTPLFYVTGMGRVNSVVWFADPFFSLVTELMKKAESINSG